MNNQVLIINLVPKERALFLKEENAKMYKVRSYYFGKLIVELPLVVIFPVLFDFSIYWIVGYNTTSPSIFFIFSIKNLYYLYIYIYIYIFILYL